MAKLESSAFIIAEISKFKHMNISIASVSVSMKRYICYTPSHKTSIPFSTNILKVERYSVV